MKKFLPYLVIALMCITAFWQVAFLTQSLKYDILDGYLPGHYFLSECLRNGIFPLWNPYQQLGFPIYADLSNTNYLIDMITGRFFPYTNITFHIFFILYLILAGIGVYKLSARFQISKRISLLTAIAYALSGFFTGNAQHIQFVVGAAWLPFSLYYFIELTSKRKITDTLLFVLTTSLLISGGYPSIAIMLAYILGMLFLYKLFFLLKSKEYKTVLIYMINCLAAGILLLALCSGILISIWQSTPYVGRFIELSYDFSVTNPFTPESLISIIAPLVPAVYPSLFHTDLSMNNHYFSVVMLIFFIYGLFNSNNLKSIMLLILGFSMLLLSFGEHFFVHRLFYEYVPLFDKFRHPSTFRVFTILFSIIYAGFQVSRFDPSINENFIKFKKIYLVFILLILGICLISLGLIIQRALGPVDFKPTWNGIINDYGVLGPLFVQTAIILFLNSFFIFFIIIKGRLHLFYPLLSVLLIAEVFVFTQLNLNYTVTFKHNPYEIRDFLSSRPKGFPLPDQHLISENTEKSVSDFPLINNTNTYAKTVSPYARYPFYLNNFNNLKNDSLRFRNTTGNHLLYFSDSSGSSNKMLNDSITCTYFSPSQMIFKTHSDSAHLAVLLQNNYPGWNVKLDGTRIEHFSIHHCLIGITIPPGTHEIVYQYSNQLYKRATLFSFALFALLLLIVLGLLISRYRTTWRGIVFAVSGSVVLTVALRSVRPVLAFEKIQESNKQEINEYLKNNIANEDGVQPFLLLNIESPESLDTDKWKNVMYTRFRFQYEGKVLWDMLDTLKANKLIYVWSNVIELPEIRDIIKMHFPVITEQIKGERFVVIECTSDTTGNEPVQKYLNNYESLMPQWTSNGIIHDSTISYSGRFSEVLTPEREFSSTFHYSLDHVPAGGIKVFAALQFMYDGDQPLNLVITVSRKGKTVHYHSIDLSQFHTNKSGWNIGFASQQWLKSSLRKGDEIMVYCWNNGKNGSVYLDDFLVSLNFNSYNK